MQDFWKVFDSDPIIDEDGEVTYLPILGGWRAEHRDGRTEYVYLNPSGGSDDGVPNVFLYQGSEGDPAADQPVVHVSLFEEE